MHPSDFDNKQDIEALLELQKNRELQMNQIGIADLRRREKKAAERMYASHSIFGTEVRRNYTKIISNALRDYIGQIKKGKCLPGRRALNVLDSVLSWDRVAYIALSTMLDAAGIPRRYQRLTDKKRKELDLITLNELYFMIAKRIEVEANLQHLRKNFRHKYAQLKEEFFTQHASYDQRVTNIKRDVRGLTDYFQSIASGTRITPGFSPDKARSLSELFTWVEWSQDIKAQIGSIVASIVSRVTGFFDWTHSYNQKGHNQKLFVFSEVYNEERDKLIAFLEQRVIFKLPMLVPPKPWTQDSLGGFWFADRAYSRDIVRGHRQRNSLKDGERSTKVSQTTLNFINFQQSVAFTLDKEMLAIQDFLYEKGWSVLGSNPDDERVQDAWRPYKAPDHIPTLPVHLQGVKKPKPDSTPEHRELYNEKKRVSQEITRFHTRQQELRMLAKGVERYRKIINIIRNDEMFFFPWDLDWRTRCYPQVDGFNPQGPEYQKAILNFAEYVPVDDRTEFWLRVGVASAAGQDKESFESRVSWTYSNESVILKAANDPLGDGFHVWTSMPEPWIFLRACLEYKRIIIEGQTFTNIFCLGQDATQSGLQLLGGMSLCRQTCDLVNCTPGHDKPQDAYSKVLETTIKLIEEDDGSFPVDKIRGKRKLVKTPVMTKVYAAGHKTRVGQIRNALFKMNIRLNRSDDRNEEMIEYLTTKVELAMTNTIPGVDAILKFFQDVVNKALDPDDPRVDDILYETESGNIITVSYYEPITKEVTTESLGTGVCLPASLKSKTKREKTRVIVARKKQSEIDDVVRAIAANFTHGAGDASLLQLAYEHPDFDTSSRSQQPVFIGTTHDCVYAPPSRLVDDYRDKARQAFHKICKSNRLQHFAELNKCPDVKLPIQGTYNPDDVLTARYFFC